MKKITGKIKLLIMCVLFSLFFYACGEEKIELKAPDETGVKVIITPTPVTGSEAVTDLKVCDNDKIIMLVSSLYSAMSEKDYSKMKPLVTDEEELNSSLLYRYEDAKSINVKKIYMIENEAPIDCIIYVYVELSYEGIETAVPTLDEYYVENVDGEYRIINGSVSRSAYNAAREKIGAEPGVAELIDSVNQKFNEALAADEALRDYVENRKKVSEDTESE